MTTSKIASLVQTAVRYYVRTSNVAAVLVTAALYMGYGDGHRRHCFLLHSGWPKSSHICLGGRYGSGAKDLYL